MLKRWKIYSKFRWTSTERYIRTTEFPTRQRHPLSCMHNKHTHYSTFARFNNTDRDSEWKRIVFNLPFVNSFPWCRMNFFVFASEYRNTAAVEPHAKNANIFKTIQRALAQLLAAHMYKNFTMNRTKPKKKKIYPVFRVGCLFDSFGSQFFSINSFTSRKSVHINRSLILMMKRPFNIFKKKKQKLQISIRYCCPGL